jgi:hypothetical protein
MPVLPNMPLPGATNTSSSVASQIGSAFSNAFQGAVGLSQASTRQNVADMFQYSQRTAGPAPVLIFPDASNDWRVRVTLAPNSTYFYNDPNNTLLSPLVTELNGGSTNPVASNVSNLFGLGGSGARRVGVIFPYTPQLQVTHVANYSPQKLTHNNYTQYFYDNSEVQAITVNAEFTVQNVNEGQYLLATIYFFRAVTKMFFGQDPQAFAGNPPPMVYLNGYGQYYLPNVPCVVTSFSHTMPADVDYMDIPEPGVTSGFGAYNPQYTNPRLNSTRMPTTSTISLSLQPVYSRTAQSQMFSLNDFAAGALVNNAGAAGPTSAFGSSQTPSFVKRPNNGGFI